MIKKLLVIGENSKLAKNFLDTTKGNKKFSLMSCRHNKVPTDIGDIDYVINFSLDPRMYSDKYEKDLDQDLFLAERIKNTQAKFLTISSRQVYGMHKNLYLFKESDEINPKRISNYGLNKLRSEKNIVDALGDESRLIICRSSNIFGDDVGSRNFLGIAIDSLTKNGFISLNSNRKVIKDFLPVSFHSKFIESLIMNNAFGIFNVGSGIKINLQDFCDALISGFGLGYIKDNDIIDDQFSLDIGKLNKLANFDITRDTILSNAYNIANKYRN